VTLVVLCGSLGAPAAMWEAQLPALDGRTVLRVDHPGHGAAPLAAVDDVSDLAHRVLDAAGDERFSFVGLSLGGAVGMRLALDAPDRVERLVLACTAARFGEPAQWIERAAVVRASGLGAIVDAVLGRWFTPSFHDVDAYREYFLNTDPEGYARCCEALSRFDVREALGAIDVPTLAIAATEDPTTPPDVVEAVAREIPNARFEVMPNAAHLANVERPGDFNRLLKEVL
jgi:3-oxoadipate enol-lactonase